jgi:hypothetical protein
MAIIQISRIQHRRGLQQDLPNLASAELGWSLDSQKLYIGNGTLSEGAPAEGVTEILTQNSDLFALVESFQFKALPAGFIANTSGDNEGFKRTLQEKLDDVVNVRDFGAKGDGQTDDTAAIIRALNNTYAYSSTLGGIDMHRTVYFPAGFYLVSDVIKVPPFVKIQGDGKRSTMIRSILASVSTIFVLADSNNAVGSTLGSQPGTIETQAREYIISDIGLHNNTNVSNRCLTIDGGTDVHLIRVAFMGNEDNTVPSTDQGSGKAAVFVSGASSLIPSQRIYFNGCEFRNHNTGVEILGTTQDVILRDCVFEDLFQETKAGSQVTGLIVRSCVSNDITGSVTNQSLVDRSGSANRAIGVNAAMAVGSGSITGMIGVNAYKNLVIDYKIVQGNEYRNGCFRATGNGVVYRYQDEYVESSERLGNPSNNDITISVNTATGAVTYDNQTSDPAVISFTSSYYL